MEEKNPLTTISLPRPGSGKLNAKQRYCFLFSKHLLITTRISKKPNDCYKTVKVRTPIWQRRDGLNPYFVSVDLAFDSVSCKRVSTVRCC